MLYILRYEKINGLIRPFILYFSGVLPSILTPLKLLDS